MVAASRRITAASRAGPRDSLIFAFMGLLWLALRLLLLPFAFIAGLARLALSAVNQRPAAARG